MKIYMMAGVQLTPGVAFVSGEGDAAIKHPANWSDCWTDDDYKRFGIIIQDVPDPEPEPEVPYIPVSVSPRQARIALIEAGLFDQVTALIGASSQEIQIGWEFAAEVRRDDMTLIALAGILGFSDRLDDLFVRAAQL